MWRFENNDSKTARPSLRNRLTNRCLALLCLLSGLLVFPIHSSAQGLPSGCPTAGTYSSGTDTLTSSCMVNGNLTLEGTASLSVIDGATLTINGVVLPPGGLTVDGSASMNVTDATLTIVGNLVMGPSTGSTASLTVMGGELDFPQGMFAQYSATLKNSASLTMEDNSLLVTSASGNHATLSLGAHNSSKVTFTSSKLNTGTSGGCGSGGTGAGSWLLGNFYDTSTLNVTGSTNLPTEIYPGSSVGDSPTINLTSSSFATVYLPFPPESVDSNFVVPETFSNNGTTVWSLTFGKNVSGETGFGYKVTATDIQSRLGLESYPNSQLTVTDNNGGNGGAGDVAMQFSIYVDGSLETIVPNYTISGLPVYGEYSYTSADPHRVLKLTNVWLNPFTWSIYVLNNIGSPVTVENSIVNEIAADLNGDVIVTGNAGPMTMQLGQFGAVGSGSEMTVNDGTNIWSQGLLALGGGHLTVTGSTLHGNFVTATGSGSTITLDSTDMDLGNDNTQASCTPDVINGISYPPNTNGVPTVNTQNSLGQCVFTSSTMNTYSATMGGEINGSTNPDMALVQEPAVCPVQPPPGQ